MHLKQKGLIQWVKGLKDGDKTYFFGKTEEKSREHERLDVFWMGRNKMNRRWRQNKLLTGRKIGKWVQVRIRSLPRD